MILIIGKSDSYKTLNKIQRINSLEDVPRFYGATGVLTNACIRAFALGVKELYACNVQTLSDYFHIIEQVHALTIDSIALPGLRVDDTLYFKDGTSSEVIALLNQLLPQHTFFLTDYHAQDFLDMKQFIDHYNKSRRKLERVACHKEDVVFVANHLQDSDEACVDAACAIALSPIGDYPLLQCGESYYPLEQEDFNNPIIFFKNQIPLDLFNLASGIESNIVANRITKALENYLTQALAHLTGTRFVQNTLFTAKACVDKVLTQYQDVYYEKSELNDIVIEGNTIIVEVSIVPFFSKKSIRVNAVLNGVLK